MPTPTVNPASTRNVTAATIKHEVVVTHTYKQPSYLEILPLVMPALLFGAGFLLNKLLETNKEKKRLQVVESLFYSLTSALQRNIARQSEAINDKIPNIESLDNSDLAIPLVTTLRTERLRNISDTDLYKLFVKSTGEVEESVKHLDNIVGATDFINDFKARIQLMNTDFYTRISTFNKEWITNYKKILHLSNLIVVDSRTNDTDIAEDLGKILDSISEHKEAYIDSKRDSIYALYSLFGEPLLKDTKEIREDKSNYELLLLINDFTSDYKTLRRYTNAHATQLKSLKQNLDSASESIKKAVDYFKKI